MMNSSHTTEAYAASPFMSFVGLEGSGSSTHDTSQKHQLWDWDSSHSFPFYTTHTIPTLLDAPPPSLFTTNNPLPFYFPPPPPPPPPPTNTIIPDYPRTAAFFKLEDGLSGGFGGLAGARIGLNLGHRTYFSSVDHQLMLFGRSVHHQPPRCQAEGCRADLSGAKHYHRRHKVCDFHSKAPVVYFPGGVQQRFCQQCSRFHGLAEFDDTKRSCRKRLAEHNRRRRKPQAQPTMKGGSSSSSIAPTIKAKEENQPASGAKISKQISSIIKSNTTTAPIVSSSSNTSLEGQQKKALTQYNSGSALSLGGIGGSTTQEQQRVSTFMPVEERVSQYQQQFQCQFTSPCSSANTFFPHQNFFNEGAHSGGGSEMAHHNHSSILQLGQAMFEWDFI